MALITTIHFLCYVLIVLLCIHSGDIGTNICICINVEDSLIAKWTKELLFTCRLGASIVVKTGVTLPFYAKNFYNPLCFIQYYNPETPPAEWKQVCNY